MDNISKLLKGFVIAGGVVLVVGTMLLVVLIVMRGSGDRSSDPSASPGEVAVVAAPRSEPDRCAGGAPPSQPLSVPLPAGARVEQIVPDGKCLILLGVDGAGRQFVALIDPLTGLRISLLLLGPDP